MTFEQLRERLAKELSGAKEGMRAANVDASMFAFGRFSGISDAIKLVERAMMDSAEGVQEPGRTPDRLEGVGAS